MKDKKPKQFDDVLRKMLSSPPEPRKPVLKRDDPKKAASKKKPA